MKGMAIWVIAIAGCTAIMKAIISIMAYTRYALTRNTLLTHNITFLYELINIIYV
jgi:hypothetical protein